MMPPTYDATLGAALDLLCSGPFFALDLWDRLPAVLQHGMLDALSERRTFRDALEDNAVVAALVAEQLEDHVLAADDFNAMLDDWLAKHGLDRETLDAATAEVAGGASRTG
jgi:hypothetical protein